MLFSIIIPVYNVKEYLDECLQSILNQVESFKEECEILLIDDGSTDMSGGICDIYQEKYPSVIRVFHNINHGLLWTRRFGFKHAHGDYIINCDSDDLLENNAIVDLKKTIDKYNFPDIIIYNYNSYDGKNKMNVYKNIFTTEEDCIVRKDLVLKEYLSSHSIISIWGKLVKRTCIDVNRDYCEFGRISTGEDTLQSIEFFNNAKSFVYLNKPLYDYRCGSGMTGKFDQDYYFTFKKIFNEIESQKIRWNLQDFEYLFSIKVLQTTGRAITQSRYKKWESMRDQLEYLKKINSDKMFQNYVKNLNMISKKLQRDHVLLIKLFQYKMYILICLMLRVKNLIG